MAPVVLIGGAGVGLQKLGKSGALTPQVHSFAGAGQQSFAAQLQAMQGASRKTPLSVASGKSAPPVGVSAAPATGSSASKTVANRKVSVAAHETTDTRESKGGLSGAQSLGEVPIVAPPALPLPVVHAGTAVPVQLPKALSSPGKVVASHPREGKAPIGPVSAVAGVVREEKAASDGVAPAAALQGATAAGGIAPSQTGVIVGTSATAIGPVLMTHEGSASVSGVSKGSEGGHRAAMSPGHESHDAVEIAGGAAMGETRMLVSTPHVLEVGITGGAHGWLRVRAELEHTGEVTASLVASSAASADALHKELGAMSAYLKSEVVGVSSLAVTALEKGGATQGPASQGPGSQGSASGVGAGAEGRSSQRGGEEKQPSPAGFSLALSELGTGYSLGTVPGALLGAGVGGWLNVRV